MFDTCNEKAKGHIGRRRNIGITELISFFAVKPDDKKYLHYISKAPEKKPVFLRKPETIIFGNTAYTRK